MKNQPLPDIERLQWQCRRGMLELDYVLRDFLNQRYASLDPVMQQEFVDLLQCQDQMLHDWIMGFSTPPEPRRQQLIGMMRRRS